MASKGKTPNLFIEKICPNKLEDRENKIINIKKQFNQLKNDQSYINFSKFKMTGGVAIFPNKSYTST